MKKTLILNSDYTIINFCTWKKAICLVYIKEVAHVLDFYQDYKIKSGKQNFVMPAVIILKKYVKHNFRRLKFSRSTVLKRDNYKCQYCGKTKKASELTLDHVIPKSRKGESFSYVNIVTACQPCNSKKGNKTCTEANMYPIQKPFIPTYYDVILSGINHISNEWIPYLPKNRLPK